MITIAPGEERTWEQMSYRLYTPSPVSMELLLPCIRGGGSPRGQKVTANTRSGERQRGTERLARVRLMTERGSQSEPGRQRDVCIEYALFSFRHHHRPPTTLRLPAREGEKDDRTLIARTMSVLRRDRKDARAFRADTA